MSTPPDPTAGEGLSEAEREVLSNTISDVIGRSYGFEAICRQVERIVAARESAAATRARAEALAPIIALADQWNDTPDYTPSSYDQGCVDQRHGMTMQLLEALAPDTAGESA